jgi:hypothetical protein
VNYLATIFRSRRLWGLTGTAVILYFLVVVVLGRIDMSWIMPNTKEIARAIITIWPRMPFFQVDREQVAGGQEVYYTVPTRQLTPQELARMGVTTNATAHPAPPK